MRKLEQRVGNNREQAKKMAGSTENMQYFYGARDEAEKILKMFQIEFNNELRIVNIVTEGDAL
jgi:hypothetical protein